MLGGVVIIAFLMGLPALKLTGQQRFGQDVPKEPRFPSSRDRGDNQTMNEAAEHPVRATLDKDPEDVSAMFDQVAGRYDLTNNLISLGQVHLWRAALNQAAHIKKGVSVLDVAAGTGTSSAALMAAGAAVTAVDLSRGMIAKGKALHPEVDFVLGSATDLPFPADAFDVATISFGLRNIADTEGALKEMVRVVKPGGQVLVLEFSKSPRLVRPFHDAYLRFAAPFLAKLASPAGEAYDYLSESIFDWHDQASLAALMREAGLRDVEYRNLTFGAVAIHRGTKP